MNYLRELKIKYVKTKIKNPVRRQIAEPQELVKLFQFLEEVDKEKVVSVHFDPNMVINYFEVVSIGGVDMALVSAKDIFKGVLLSNSVGFVLIHNHPHGNPTPSNNDRKIMERLEKQSEIMEIELFDFIIIGDGGRYWSWRDNMSKYL
jgi:DNA repair protein RadC